MQLVLDKFLLKLYQKANLFSRIDINGNINDSFLGKHGIKIFSSFISILFIYIQSNGISKDIVEYLSTILSIFIGLFTSALIYVLDKAEIKSDKENSNTEEKKISSSISKLWEIQEYNLTRQFSYITGYTIVLCVLTLLLLMISPLFEKQMSLNVLTLKPKLDKLDKHSIALFINAVVCLFQRFFVIYFVIRIMYNTLFVVSSMIVHSITKLDRNDRNK